MMRAWIAVALLSASWLWGLDYYRPANGVLWSVAVALGTLLLCAAPLRWPGRREAALTVGLLLPVVWWMPWPYRAAPLAIAIGLGLHLVPIPTAEKGTGPICRNGPKGASHKLDLSPFPAWPRGIAQGAVAAGMVLLGQAVVLWAYECLTARSHELPWPLPSAIGAVAALLGVDAAVDGNTLALYTFREVLRLGATWELLLDPATLAFFIGGLALLGMAVFARSRGSRWAAWLRAAGGLAALLTAWLLLRVGLLVGLLVHRVIRLDPAARMNLMDQFFSPWIYLALLVPPALAAWRLAGGAWRVVGDGEKGRTGEGEKGRRGEEESDRGRDSWHADSAEQGALPVSPSPLLPFSRPHAALCLVLAGAAVFAFWFHWQPAGRAQDGRVMFVERHSTWSPTMPAYSTTRFGEKGSYNYAAIYDYASESYTMSRLLESDRIDDEKLSTCDVLIIKIPTAPYTPEEVQAVVRFVERGGGLLLIGDHTDYERSSSHMNDITEHFGFKYRHDLLFFTGDPYYQPYTPPAVPHPIVQRVPPMQFAVSCSIEPGSSIGQAVIRGTGLWSLLPNYRSGNWFPDAEYAHDMRYGAFIQLWATAHGAGRVLAWTDSTIFSSFCTFQPGKAELFLGAINWLNHRSLFDRPWPRWTLAVVACLTALGLVAVGVRWGRATRAGGLVLLAATLLGWTAGCLATVLVHRSSFSPPEATDPKFRVVIDRTVSDVPLGRGAFSERDDGTGYGLLEQWIGRLGYVTERRSGAEVMAGDMVVVICPRKSIPRDFREGLVQYVDGGGKLLVIDSPDSPGSTANSLLWPFGMNVSHATSRQGKLSLVEGWPALEADWACETQGGTPFLWVDGLPVAARKPYGLGEVMVIGCGSALDDASLGLTWMVKPTPDVRTRSELLFILVRALATGSPVAPPPTPGPEGGAQAPKTK